MAQPPRLLVFGGGRMGRMVAEAAAAEGFTLAGVVSRQQPDWTAAGAWQPGLAGLEGAADLAIDFSLPDGTAALAPWCATHGVALVSGTTGLGTPGQAALDAAARAVPVLWAANFSPGLNACLVLAKRLRELLGPAAVADILDVHHVHKQDAPSGTALALGAAVGGEVRYHSRREGEVIGDHVLSLDLGDERVELHHHAADRRLFARGALLAGRWLLRQRPGRYAMTDCLSAGP